MLYKLTVVWYNGSMKKFIVLTAALLLFAMLGAFAEEIVAVPDWAADALNFPDAMVKIESEAFYGDTSLTDVVIPAGVQSVGQYAFAGCTGIKRIVVLDEDVVLSANALGTHEEAKTIYGLIGSTAQTYADSYGYEFVPLVTQSEADMAKKQAILAYAKTLLGQKYVSGSLDCVLYVRRCYIHATYDGKELNVVLPDSCPRMYDLSHQSEVTKKKLKVMRIDSVGDLQPGDVICWTDDKYWNRNKVSNALLPGDPNYKKCTHVGMYVADSFRSSEYSGSCVFIEASQGAGQVRYNQFTDYYRRNFLCGWRILL